MTMHSTNHAARFIRELLTNADLRRSVESVLNSQQSLRDLVIAEGFHFTRDEWDTAVERLLTPGGNEIPETTLEEIFGGASSANASTAPRETLIKLFHSVKNAI